MWENWVKFASFPIQAAIYEFETNEESFCENTELYKNDECIQDMTVFQYFQNSTVRVSREANRCCLSRKWCENILSQWNQWNQRQNNSRCDLQWLDDWLSRKPRQGGGRREKSWVAVKKKKVRGEAGSDYCFFSSCLSLREKEPNINLCS